MNVGDVLNYNYTGGVQEFEVTDSGWYKLEVYGANSAGMSGAYGGGYSKGYKKLNKGQKVYVVVGGAGGRVSGGGVTGGAGYNGGGKAWGDVYNNTFSGGAGATHMALVSGTIAEIGKTNFDVYGLLVAGGSGGGITNLSSYWTGGAGGGLTGGTAVYGPTGQTIPGATQSTGFAFGQGANNNQFKSGDWGGNSGGGGYYGGGHHSGGSGWIGGVEAFNGDVPTTIANQSTTGNGRARITFMAKSLPTINIGELTIENLMLGDNEISKVYLGETEL